MPDLDTDVTDAPFSTRSLTTRDPTKPVPPKTVTSVIWSEVDVDARVVECIGEVHDGWKGVLEEMDTSKMKEEKNRVIVAQLFIRV